ncbi:hypothetical protein H2203_004945 [Taxawa tesnikishii (nom. ined.)]|nr:hypothetical protein H2203_004945 [Dothideales sp. JES 119]
MPSYRGVTVRLQSQYDIKTIFWISYTITPPTQIQDRDRQLKFMYFKLFMNDRCVTSWGGGADNAWKGKTMWSLVDGGTDYKGRQQVERRALFFTKQGDDTGKKCEQGTFEIRIFRSIGRMRVAKEVHQFDERCKEGSAVDFVNFGQAKRKEPQRFYRYALMDPIDEPYATFRYHLRTQDQLDALNLGMRTSKDTFVSAVEEMNVDKASFSPLQDAESSQP